MEHDPVRSGGQKSERTGKDPGKAGLSSSQNTSLLPKEFSVPVFVRHHCVYFLF